ncbi:ATP-binding Cassette (ABC) Superfamily, partial [Achlya hypogyna]
VGDLFFKGISGGQKRRLSIAIALLTNPSILLLDEPTSGLDSASTYHIMKYIAKLCSAGRTVVCTIHQPSSQVYAMFGTVSILVEGRTVFYGPPPAALNHFAGLGYPCPTYSNPAEYFVSLVNTDFEGHADVAAFVKAYASSDLCSSVVRSIEAEAATTGATDAPIECVGGASAWTQWAVLMHRNTLNNVRNPGIYWVRLFMYIMLSFMVGTMYYHTNTDLTEQDLLPMLFYVQAFLVFMSVAVLPFFIEQRAVFVRERANQSLHVGSYVVANLLAALPGIALISILSTLLVVLLADLNGFGYFFLNLFLSLVAAESLMCVIAAAVPHYIIGIALGAGLFGMFMLCEGFMVPKDAIPDYWIWAYYMAFHTYSFESFVYTHFNPIQESNPVAKTILKKYGFENVDVPRNMGILAAYTALFQVIFVFILYKFHTGRR